MQKQIKILLTLLTALILAVSCAENNPNNPTEDLNTPPDNEWVNNANFTKLQQKWVDNTGGGYTITADKVDNFWNNNGAETKSYSISIKYIKWTSETAGIIYGQYTTAPSYAPERANKWYAIAFKDLTTDAIDISGASKQLEDGSYDAAAETLAEAISKFTEANGYITFNEYTKHTASK